MILLIILLVIIIGIISVMYNAFANADWSDLVEKIQKAERKLPKHLRPIEPFPPEKITYSALMKRAKLIDKINKQNPVEIKEYLDANGHLQSDEKRIKSVDHNNCNLSSKHKKENSSNNRRSAFNLVGREIQFTYSDADGIITLRTVEVSKSDNSTFSGICYTRNDTRTFRVNRVVSDIVDVNTGEIVL